MATKTAAARKNTAQTDAPTEETKNDPTAGLGFSLTVQRGTEIKRQAPKREKEPNPTEEAVKHSKDTGEVLAYPLPDEEAVKKVMSLIRRAASDADHGVAFQTVKQEDGTYVLNFQATAKRERKYTAKEIRDWAVENGYPQYTDSKLKITDEVRDAFKTAKGFNKKASAK